MTNCSTELPDIIPDQSSPRSLDRAANRAAVVEFALGVSGHITTVVYDAVSKAIADGALTATMPDRTTFYRWLVRIHPSAIHRRPAAAEGMGGADLVEPSQDDATDGVADDDSAELTAEQKARVIVVEERFNTLAAMLATKDKKLFRQYCIEHRNALKWLGHAKDGHLSEKSVAALLARVEETTVVYVTVLKDAGVAMPASLLESPRLVSASAPPVSGTAVAATSPAPVVRSVDPASMPVYTAPGEAEVPANMRWGARAAQELRPSYGVVVGHITSTLTEAHANIRARLLAPVLNCQMELAACAEFWRSVFQGKGTPEGQALAHGITAEYRLKYRDLAARTLRRWRDLVLEAKALAQEAGDETAVNVSGVLRHSQTTLRAPRKATLQVIDLACELYTTHLNWSKARVARHLREELGVDLSERLVQTILAERLSDVDRAIARGGPAAPDEMFRRRLFREAKYPNRTWIMDHSFLRQECALPEHLGQVPDFDFEFECRADNTGTSKRVRGLCLTLIMDACTRRTLATRVWQKAPDTRMTLLVLRDAIARFGVPEILYTDNGADLNSHAVREALGAAGIHQVNSQPYTPQGRGKIERLFRTVKTKVLEGMAGYYGGRHGAQWGDSDLLSLEEVNERVSAGIDLLMNRQPHGSTRRVPTEHYEAEIGARRLAGIGVAIASPEALLSLLLVQHDVLVRTNGFVFLGHTYYSPDLAEVPNGARIIVYYDPSDLAAVHVCVRGPNGEIRYLGVAEYYDKDHEPPSFVEQQLAEAAWRADQAQRRQQREAARAHAARIAQHRADGEVLGVAAADAAFEDARALSEPRPPLALPEGSSANSTEGTAETPTALSASESSSPDEPPRQSDTVSDVAETATGMTAEVLGIPTRRRRKQNAPLILSMPWD